MAPNCDRTSGQFVATYGVGASSGQRLSSGRARRALAQRRRHQLRRGRPSPARERWASGHRAPILIVRNNVSSVPEGGLLHALAGTNPSSLPSGVSREVPSQGAGRSPTGQALRSPEETRPPDGRRMNVSRSPPARSGPFVPLLLGRPGCSGLNFSEMSSVSRRPCAKLKSRLGDGKGPE